MYIFKGRGKEEVGSQQQRQMHNSPAESAQEKLNPSRHLWHLAHAALAIHTPAAITASVSQTLCDRQEAWHWPRTLVANVDTWTPNIFWDFCCWQMQRSKSRNSTISKEIKKNHNLLRSFALDFSKFKMNIKKISEDLDFAAITLWSKTEIPGTIIRAQPCEVC